MEMVLNMTVLDLIAKNLSEFRSETNTKLEAIQLQVTRTNGRVDRLEQERDDKEDESIIQARAQVLAEAIRVDNHETREALAVETSKRSALVLELFRTTGFCVFVSIFSSALVLGLTFRNDIGPICSRILTHWGY